ncbi:DNA-directed RNA polymerase III subunit RPC9 [Toxorhynchites rutilus septentrionalis]|uniref:DNA-directed RNA polymerase III subunit RPC9 n=1 Tax=Toxorhynchites rutilus septentrionalis TaxID=329112 RepID=UPI002479A857|nr:DNA-directed RNA polymerase III subunit RPC9 [Toxorhynchites rutilus septentrionalis]
MEIINPNAAILTNFEVMTALKDMKSNKKKHGLRNLATITYETVQFLEETACKDETNETIMEFLRAMKQFNLAKNECLMLINEPPTSPLHIQLVIEDSDERLTDEQVNQIIEYASKLRNVETKE